MHKIKYIHPSLLKVDLDSTSILLTGSQEPPTSGSETGTDIEDGDDSIDIIGFGGTNSNRLNSSQSSPFGK